MLKREGQLGQIIPHATADLLILDTNPLVDIRILDRPEKHLLAILKEGRVVTSRVAGLEVDYA